MDWNALWTQFVFPLLLDLPNVAVATGAFIQAYDALNDHRDALPGSKELYMGDDKVAPEDMADGVKMLFSPHGRGTNDVVSAEVKAERVLQGWTWITLGAYGLVIVGALSPIRYAIEHAQWVPVLAVGIYACGLYTVSVRPGILPEFERHGRLFNIFLWPGRLLIPTPKEVNAFNEKIDDFKKSIEEVEHWPAWVEVPELVNDPEYDGRIMVALKPSFDWGHEFEEQLHECLKRAGLRPKRLPSGGLATRFCDAHELSRALSEFDSTGSPDIS